MVVVELICVPSRQAFNRMCLTSSEVFDRVWLTASVSPPGNKM